MTSSNGENMVMPVQPMVGYGGYPMMGNGFGNGFGGDGWWIILLFLLAGNNGWGGFGGGNGADIYPWMNQSDTINGGFRDQMLNSTVNGISSAVTSGFGDVQTALCSGFAGTTAAVTGAQTALSQQMYTNQIADMERSFAAQTANTAGMSGLQSQLAQCCCDNRLASADLKYTIATENCADRAALSDGIRDVLAATQAQTQTILDKLCQQEIDALKAQNADLRSQVAMKDLAASQTAQTAALVADNAAQTQYVVNRVAPYPIPSYNVPSPYGYGYNGYGCGCNSGCGCGA